MIARAADLAVYGFALTAAGYLAFGLYLVAMRDFARDGAAASRAFVAAVLCSALWAGASAWAASGLRMSPGRQVALELLDVARYGLWFTFLVLLVKPTLDRTRHGVRSLRTLGVLVVVVAAAMSAYRALMGEIDEPPDPFMLASTLAMPVLGLLDRKSVV